MHDEEQTTAFNLGNLVFGFLGSWCAVVVCLMVYAPDAEAPASREPAQEPIEEVQPPAPTESFEPSAYFLSFNSIHLEK